MAALLYFLLLLSLYVTLGTVCAAVPANFSGSAAYSGYNSDDYNSDDDRRTDLRASLQYPSSICRAKKTSNQINHVPCRGQSAERFEYGKRFVKVNNTEDAINIRFLMPGIGKEDVVVYIHEKDGLIVEGKKVMDFDEGKFVPRFVLHLPMSFLKANETTAEMKNGVLKVRVPKTKQQQQMSDVFDETISSHSKRRVQSSEQIADMSRDMKFKVTTDAIHLRRFVRKENTKVWVELMTS